MNYIDFHIHYLPESVNAEKIIEAMTRLKIEKSVVLATPDHPRYTDMQLTGNNKKVLELCKTYPAKFIPACYIEPRNIMEAQTLIQQLYEQGVRFLKMWPAHGFSPDDPTIYPVWEKINSLKMGVIFHSGSLGVRTNLPIQVRRSTGFNAKFGQPFFLDHPARCFPDIKFIIAHSAYPWTLEALEMSYMFENIYIDFSCGLGYEGYNLIKCLHPERIAWDRILFGSDTAGLAEPFVMKWTKLMTDEFFAPHAEDFFYNNAQKLLNVIK